MKIIKDGDKYIKSEYEALAARLAGAGAPAGAGVHPSRSMEQQFYIDMYWFACWALTIDELKPSDKMAYIAEITGIEVTKKRVNAMLSMQPAVGKPDAEQAASAASAGTKPDAGQSGGKSGRRPATPEIITSLTAMDIATGNTFGQDAESLTERCLRFMELFSYSICTVGKRKFSKLEKETIESYISRMRAEMRRTFEQAEKDAKAGQNDNGRHDSGAAGPAGRPAAGRNGQPAAHALRRQNPMDNGARDRLIATYLDEPAPVMKPDKSPLQLARGRKLLVTCVICILVGIFLVAVVVLLIDESKSNVAVLESYTGHDYTKEQIAGFIQEQKDAQGESLLNILWTILTQILPGILGWAALKWGKKPLIAGEVLSIAGIVRTVVMLFIGPSWMALAEVPQLFLIVFAERYRRCLEE